jgi:tetratricopeptide (TPR) repeat protein
MGQVEDSIYFYKQLLAINPEDSGAYCSLGNALSDARLFKEAEWAYQRSIDLDPVNILAYKNYAIFFEETGRFKEAVCKWKMVRRLGNIGDRKEANKAIQNITRKPNR